MSEPIRGNQFLGMALHFFLSSFCGLSVFSGWNLSYFPRIQSKMAKSHILYSLFIYFKYHMFFDCFFLFFFVPKINLCKCDYFKFMHFICFARNDIKDKCDFEIVVLNVQCTGVEWWCKKEIRFQYMQIVYDEMKKKKHSLNRTIINYNQSNLMKQWRDFCHSQGDHQK